MTRSHRYVRAALVIAVGAMACAREAGHDDESAAARAESAAAAGDTVASPEAVARARAAAGALGQELMPKLFAALDSGGPTSAVAYCADSAQAWTARHAAEGVYLRRVSLRVRNPANRPDSLEERLLRHLDSLHRSGALPPEVVRSTRGPGGERTLEYARPILVQERCLACHGDRERLAPGVRAILDARYPSDQATGYSVGDLRGMISVRVRQ